MGSIWYNEKHVTSCKLLKGNFKVGVISYIAALRKMIFNVTPFPWFCALAWAACCVRESVCDYGFCNPGDFTSIIYLKNRWSFFWSTPVCILKKSRENRNNLRYSALQKQCWLCFEFSALRCVIQLNRLRTGHGRFNANLYSRVSQPVGHDPLVWAMEEFLMGHDLVLLKSRTFCKMNLLIENWGSSWAANLITSSFLSCVRNCCNMELSM